MNQFHETYDLLLTPSVPVVAFDAGREVADLLKEKSWTDWSPFTYPFNLTQQPAASVPCALSSTGLPIGMQIGPRFADARVLSAARAFESLRPFPLADVTALAT